LRGQFWTAPNQLTLLRFIFIPFVIICVFDGNWTWALALIVAAGASDALDGLLARALNQRTVLGQYLDPIADKMLLSSLFLVLSFVKKIPWKYTVLVFSRDALILAICVVLYAAVGFRDFRPSIFGKINTVCQISAVLFVILAQLTGIHWVLVGEKLFLWHSLGACRRKALPVRDLHLHFDLWRALHFTDRSTAEKNGQPCGCLSLPTASATSRGYRA